MPCRFNVHFSSKRIGTKFGVTPLLIGGYAAICGMDPQTVPCAPAVLAAVHRHGAVSVSDLARELELDPDDVLDACKVFKDTLGMTGLCFNTQEFHFTQYCLSFGGGWDLGKTIDTPENAAALQFIIDAYHQGYVVTPKELGVSYDATC